MADLGAIAAEIGLAEGLIGVLSVRVHHGPTTKTVSGIVYDDSSTPCARTVRLYRRSDGVFLGEVTSHPSLGTYSILSPTDEVDRIVLDDSAGVLYNDLIDRVIPG